MTTAKYYCDKCNGECEFVDRLCFSNSVFCSARGASRALQISPLNYQRLVVCDTLHTTRRRSPPQKKTGPCPTAQNFTPRGYIEAAHIKCGVALFRLVDQANRSYYFTQNEMVGWATRRDNNPRPSALPPPRPRGHNGWNWTTPSPPWQAKLGLA